ncbi:MAG: DUF368 domain-containing protein [Lachnospiraceae bacterium]|nr:DUF368 domain-containing protein [Lachnospiraceae bacterium]
MIKIIIKIIKGTVVGLTNTIPGVSGGTLMVTLGMYDEYVTAIGNILKKFKESFMKLWPYVIGMAIGSIGLAFGIKYLFELVPVPTACAFVGLILGSIPCVYKNSGIKKIGFSEIFFFILGIALITTLQVLSWVTGNERSLDPSLSSALVALFLGVVGAATMVIPGVSGSMILMILGYYNILIANLVPSFIKHLIAFGSNAYFYNIMLDFTVIGPFAIGMFAGLFLVSKLISKLLEVKRQPTYAFILGLVISSPIAVFSSKEIAPALSSIGVWDIIFGVIMLAVGFVAALFLSKEE